MGLLAKTNPTATRTSVVRQAIIWGTIGVIACVAFLWRQPDFAGWPLLLPLAGLLGATLGALMEWQLDDGMEIYTVVQEIEVEFAITIVEWEKIDTVGDLYHAMLAKLRDKDPNSVDDEHVWRRLRETLVEQLRAKPEQIVPAARFYIDLGL